MFLLFEVSIKIFAYVTKIWPTLYKGSIKESLNYSDRLHCDPFEIPVNKDKVEFAKNYILRLEQ